MYKVIPGDCYLQGAQNTKPVDVCAKMLICYNRNSRIQVVKLSVQVTVGHTCVNEMASFQFHLVKNTQRLSLKFN